MNRELSRSLAGLATGSGIAAWLLAWGWAGRGASQGDEEQPLPGRVVIDVDSPERALYRIAIPNLLGASNMGAQGADVIRNDLMLSSLFQVLDSRSFLANLQAEGLGITKTAWSMRRAS